VTALESIERWGAAPVAAAVIGPEGVLETHGAMAEVFALASVTKPLFAYAVLVAVEEGSLELDQPAGPPGSTLRHLLAHASGLGPDGGVLSPPGRTRIYSNAGFDEIGDLLRDRTGVDVATYLAEAVLEPLGMRASLLRGSPAHAAMSTGRDLASFARELLRPTLVSARTLAEATRVQIGDLSGVLPGFGRQAHNDWGLGFELRDAKSPHWTGSRNSARTFGHFGRSGTFLWVDPDADLALVCLTGRVFGPWAAEAWPALSDAVLVDNGR